MHMFLSSNRIRGAAIGFLIHVSSFYSSFRPSNMPKNRTVLLEIQHSWLPGSKSMLILFLLIWFFFIFEWFFDACRRHIVGHWRCHQTQDSTRRPHLGYGRGRDIWRGRRVSTANGQTLDTQRVGLHRTARVVRARGSNGRRFPPSHDFLRELNYLFYPSVGEGGNSFQTNGKKTIFHSSIPSCLYPIFYQ